MRALAAAVLAAAALAGCRADPSTFVPIEGADAATDASMPSGIHVQVTPATTTVSEGGQTTVQVRLSEAPPAERTIDVVGGALLAPTPASLTFTPETWSVNRTVILAAGQDDDADDDPVTVLFSGRGEVADGAATVMVTDDDELALTITPPISVGITEGASAEVQVFLSARPGNQLVVAVTTADGGRASAAPGSLVFTPDAWATPQTVTVTAPHDLDTANATTMLVLDPERDGMVTRTIGVDVTDDDILAIDVTPTNLGTLTEAAGTAHTATIGVRLTQLPPGNVVVDLTAAPGAVAVSPSRLIFTPADYATVRHVTVTALGDDDVVDEQVAIRLAAAGLSDRFVHVAIDDDDVQALQVTPLVVPPLAEGATADLGVRLAHRPADSVVVTVASTAPEVAAIDATELTFTPASFDVVQTVRVTALEDANLVDGSATITFNAAAAGLGASRVIEVDDQDVQGLVLSAPSLAVDEGGQASFTVRLLHEPAGPVAVSVGAGAAELGVAPAMLTFSPADHATPQPVVLTGQHDPDTADEHVVVTVGAPDVDSETVAVTIVDDDGPGIRVWPSAMLIGEGASQELMVTLAAQPAADVTVTLSAQPAGVVTLGVTSLTFTPADYATPRAVTVGGADDANSVDETTTIHLDAPGLIGNAVPVDVIDDE